MPPTVWQWRSRPCPRDRPQARAYTANEVPPTLPTPERGNYVNFNRNAFDSVHNEGANILYCDGHVKWSKKTAIQYVWFGLALTGTLSVEPDDRKFVAKPDGTPEAAFEFRAAI